MRFSVAVIGGLSVPAKVFHAIVCCIPIVMAGNHPFGALSNKCFQNHRMDVFKLSVTVPSNADRLVAVLVSIYRRQNPFVIMAFPITPYNYSGF